MPKKIKTITLSHKWTPIDAPTKEYRVERVTDSVEFSPLSFLTKAEVDELCEAPHWKVAVIARPKP